MLKFICDVKGSLHTNIYGIFFNRPDIFNVVKVPINARDFIDIDRITLDENDDYELINKIYNSYGKEHIIKENDIKTLLKKQPELQKINKQVVQRAVDTQTKNNINNFFNKNKKILLKIKTLIMKK